MLAFKITPANVHDSQMLPPLIEAIEENLPNKKIEQLTGDKGYESKANSKFLDEKKIKNDIISKEEPKTKPEKMRRKESNSRRALIEITFGLMTTKLGLERPRVRGLDTIHFNTGLVLLAILCVNLVAVKIGRNNKINCPTFFFK